MHLLRANAEYKQLTHTLVISEYVVYASTCLKELTDP
jgi:hypothetical protein